MKSNFNPSIKDKIFETFKQAEIQNIQGYQDLNALKKT